MVCPHCEHDLEPVVSGPYVLSEWTPLAAAICCRNCMKPVPMFPANWPEAKGLLVDLPKAA
jgi:hypothetical protein